MLKNLILIAVSVAAVLVLSFACDWAVGKAAPEPRLPGVLELIFPPHAQQTFETTEFMYTAHINSLGLRERELPPERGDVFRIVAIGDSYTYGWGVEQEQTWLRLLEELLAAQGYPVQTVNLGKPGSGPPDYAALAERAVPILRPDLILVVLLQGNDLGAAGPENVTVPKGNRFDFLRQIYPNTIRLLHDLRRNRDFGNRGQQEMPPQKSSGEDNRRWAANTAQEFHEKMTPEERARFDALEDRVKEAFLTGNLNPYLIDLALKNPQFYCLTMDLENPWTKTCIERTAGQLARIKKVADDFGAAALVLSIPEGAYVNEEALRNIRRVGYNVPDNLIDNTAPDEGIRLAAERAGLPFLSVSDAFRARRTETGLFYELDGHLTVAGHRLYGEALSEALTGAFSDLLPARQ